VVLTGTRGQEEGIKSRVSQGRKGGGSIVREIDMREIENRIEGTVVRGEP